MIIFKNKIFTENYKYKKLPYFSTSERIKDSAKAFGGGGVIGAIGGGLTGSLLGRKGAKIGAILGGLAGGILSSKASWNYTSKENIDKLNKYNRDIQKREDMFRNNPRLRYKNIEDTKNLEKQFRDIESKYKIKYGDDFYKYINLRKKLIPTLVNLEKNGMAVKDRYGILMEINPNLSKYWVDGENQRNKENLNSLISINPEMADDTYIVYNFKTGKYGYDSYQNNFPNLKSILLDKLNDDEDYINKYEDKIERKGDLEFIKKYRELINKEL